MSTSINGPRPDDGRRLTIAEYVQMWKRSSSPASLLVESKADKETFLEYLREHTKEVDVFSGHIIIDDRELQLKHGFSTGAKGKLLTVANLLARTGVPESACVVVDRDYDGIGSAPKTHALCTDFHSLEMYAYNPTTVARIFGFLFGPSGVSGEEVITAIDSTLRWVGHLRAYGRSTEGGATSLPSAWLKQVDWDARPASVNKQEVVRLMLAAASRPSSNSACEAVIAAVDDVNAADDTDSRLLIRGHDFSEALLKFAQGRAFKKKGVDLRGWSELDMSNLLRLALVPSQLDSFELFSQLRLRW